MTQIPPFTWTLTLMLLVANLANTKLCKSPEKIAETKHMGTHPMNTNMTGLIVFENLCMLVACGWA